ncbi:AAA family ATPase [Aquibacillus koreensis]|uniref:AAA family ATPase n=1 Tax=Aquibacillus koreensis TaxID=279446 RepID=A0A9X3WKA6_9BACI|nr:AAA family ATPase [Aquibacillus koreensis]MCT2536384.1 AAA family ATPase [Aquibacillus koreensis]MDC3421265.1 AAA family ATPase [Aquibacillus koreensis]
MTEEKIAHIEKKINSWQTIEALPPLTEVEILRLLDDIETTTFSRQSISILYSMLAFYRLKRDFNDDQITATLLSKANNYDETPAALVEILNLKSFFHFYSRLEQVALEQWSFRETDFDSAKMKKAKELLEVVDDLLHDQIKNVTMEEHKLLTIYNDIIQELKDLKETLENVIDLLKNRRSGVPVQVANDHIKRLEKLRNNFYAQFPNVFQTSSYDNPLEKLDHMVGLKDVKKYIHEYYHYLKYQKERKELGFQMVDEPSLHMIITGNPGTGKTTIARLLAEIYYELGLLETNEVVEVNRSHLVGSYVGQSEENTMNFVKQSLGGILFIDEAYSLKREGQGGNDYGQAVIDTLVSSMTSKEFANRFAVILAGYPEEMRQFLWSNPGLRSRIPEQNQIILPNFQMEELLTIAEDTALSNDYFFTSEAINKFRSSIEKAKVDESFGNARTVRDLVLKAIFKKGASRPPSVDENWIEHMRIDSEDLDIMDDSSSDGQPMQQLENLIGLSNIKQEVRKLSSFVRVQQQRKKQGFPPVPVQLHAVFSGNPGTGKTTVAKIYSQILKECGLLKRGHFILASRSDLVAGYVGQTAIKTKQKVREALGGVLFIDEAYSLFRGEKDFGKEAIDTLVDEMTKHNENLVVILAGYKNEMEQFISSNPGLQSRFKKYFEFDDYNHEELIRITSHHVQNYQYKMTEQAEVFLKEKFTQTKIEGNARFVVNLIDEAIQFQALRMVEAESHSTEDYQALMKEDFEHAWKVIRGKHN